MENSEHTHITPEELDRMEERAQKAGGDWQPELLDDHFQYDFPRLISALREAREALQQLKETASFYRFEWMAERFHQETGMMAPGKDLPLPLAAETSEEYAKRSAAWNKFLSDNRAALPGGEGDI